MVCMILENSISGIYCIFWFESPVITKWVVFKLQNGYISHYYKICFFYYIYYKMGMNVWFLLVWVAYYKMVIASII